MWLFIVQLFLLHTNVFHDDPDESPRLDGLPVKKNLYLTFSMKLSQKHFSALNTVTVSIAES